MTIKQNRIAVAVLVALFLLLAGCAATEADVPLGDAFHTGRVIVKGDAVLLVEEDGSPVVLHDASVGGKLFAGLQTGDKVQVYYEFVAESYPAQASTAYCRLLESGTLEDIPAETRQELERFGWLETP